MTELCCESCLKTFHNSGLFVHILQHGRNKNSPCFKFYIDKYKHIDLFPFSKFSKNRKYHCECCDRWFIQLYRHLRQYSDVCINHYQTKYGEEYNWPVGATKVCFCRDCNMQLPDHRAEYCANCRHTKYNVMKNPTVLRKQMTIVSETNKKPEVKKRRSLATKKWISNHPTFRQDQKNYMLSGGASLALSCNHSPSKPQVELFNIVKEIYPDAILDYRLVEANKVLDIAVLDLKLDIEYDGSYWHQDLEADIKREKEIRSMGWDIIRYRDYIPTIKELKDDIENKI